MGEIKEIKDGLFFVIEGIDGAGKSTQAIMLADWLKDSGYAVIITREPTEDSSFGKEIRKSMLHNKRFTPEKELELFMLDRKKHLKSLIIPALMEKKIVICDRYYYSNIAYQGAAGLDTEEIRRINEEFALIPDAVFYLKVDVKEGLYRIKNFRNSKFTSFEKTDFLKKVREIFNKMDFDYFHTIDANRTAEKVSIDIINIVNNIIHKKEKAYAEKN